MQVDLYFFGCLYAFVYYFKGCDRSQGTSEWKTCNYDWIFVSFSSMYFGFDRRPAILLPYLILKTHQSSLNAFWKYVFTLPYFSKRAGREDKNCEISWSRPTVPRNEIMYCFLMRFFNIIYAQVALRNGIVEQDVSCDVTSCQPGVKPFMFLMQVAGSSE